MDGDEAIYFVGRLEEDFFGTDVRRGRRSGAQ
jgi:hypothetical protein